MEKYNRYRLTLIVVTKLWLVLTKGLEDLTSTIAFWLECHFEFYLVPFIEYSIRHLKVS